VQDTDRYGRWFWFRKIRCLNCGSLKIEKYAVGDTRFANRLSVKRERPPGWYAPELRTYWSAARQARADHGLLGSIDTTQSPLENDNVVNFQQTGT
jgi:hypothetical protein